MKNQYFLYFSELSGSTAVTEWTESNMATFQGAAWLSYRHSTASHTCKVIKFVDFASYNLTQINFYFSEENAKKLAVVCFRVA